MQLTLGGSGWPARALGVVAVDVESGGAVVLDAPGDAKMEQAVAESCSLPGLSPPVSVAGHCYMDGGMRSGMKADLMTGCETILLATPPEPAAERILERAQVQVESLAARGARTRLISPDEACLAIGLGIMDIRQRPAVAEAGKLQGAAMAAAVRTFAPELASEMRAPAVSP